MTEVSKPITPVRAPLPTPLKLVLDFGPLLVFFVANKVGDVFIATAASLVATAIAMAIFWIKTRHIPPMQILTGVIIVIFSGLTLWLHDDRFIKIKPTLIYASFASILVFGLVTKRPTLKLVLGDALPTLTDTGWAKLTRNWALFFVVMMGANEVARQVLTTDQWVNFKVWGVTAVTMLFAFAQGPLLAKHGVKMD